MESSCIKHPEKDNEHELWKFYVCRFDYNAICEASHETPKVQLCAAILLNVFEQWANFKIDEKSQVDRHNELAAREGWALRPFSEWVYESAESLSQRLRSHFSRQTVQRSLAWLVDEGYLFRRQNPSQKFDKAYQYKLNIPLVQAKINALLPAQSGQPIAQSEQSRISGVLSDQKPETRMVVDCSDRASIAQSEHNKDLFLINRNTKHSTIETLNTQHQHDRAGMDERFSDSSFSDQLETPEAESRLSTSLSKKQEPIARMKKSVEDQSSAAAPRKVKSVRVGKKKPELTIRNAVNDLGWLQMDKRPRLKLARYVATQRISILLAVISGYEFAPDKAGTWYTREDSSKHWATIARTFSADSHDLAYLRDNAIENGGLSQDEFNNLLEAIFEASAQWCDLQGKNANTEIDLKGIWTLFTDDDRELLRQITAA